MRRRWPARNWSMSSPTTSTAACRQTIVNGLRRTSTSAPTASITWRRWRRRLMRWAGSSLSRSHRRGRRQCWTPSAAGKTAMVETLELTPGGRFPDLDLPDHTGRPRTLAELAGGDPLALFSSRGWWCPKEQRYIRELCRLQDEAEVAYSRIVVLSVDAPETQSAFRAGLGARFTFLSDAERGWLPRLPLCEGTEDRKSTRLNSSHVKISYAVF